MTMNKAAQRALDRLMEIGRWPPYGAGSAEVADLHLTVWLAISFDCNTCRDTKVVCKHCNEPLDNCGCNNDADVDGVGCRECN